MKRLTFLEEVLGIKNKNKIVEISISFPQPGCPTIAIFPPAKSTVKTLCCCLRGSSYSPITVVKLRFAALNSYLFLTSLRLITSGIFSNHNCCLTNVSS